MEEFARGLRYGDVRKCGVEVSARGGTLRKVFVGTKWSRGRRSIRMFGRRNAKYFDCPKKGIQSEIVKSFFEKIDLPRFDERRTRKPPLP